MKQRFKNWLIRKLGGYTYDRVHYLATLYCESEIRLRVHSRGMTGSQYLEAEKAVRDELAREVDRYFIRALGYRGNTPRKPF